MGAGQKGTAPIKKAILNFWAQGLLSLLVAQDLARAHPLNKNNVWMATVFEETQKKNIEIIQRSFKFLRTNALISQDAISAPS